MKKLLLSFLLCFTLNTVVHGQAALLVLIFGERVASESFHLSIDGGINYSSLPGIAGQEAKLYPYFGMGSFIKLNNKWALTPEFKPLSFRGAQGVPAVNSYPATLTDVKYTLSANYIDLPVLLQFKISRNWFVSSGPQFSFLLSEYQYAEGKMPAGNEVRIRESINSVFNSMYYVLPVELGYTLSDQRGGKGIDIKLRYNLGLTEMIADDQYGSSYGSTFQFFLSFPFVTLPDESKK